MTLLAQLAPTGYSFAQIAQAIIFAVCVIGIVLIVVKAAGINLPSWVWAILGLVALGFLAIFGIRVLSSA